MSRTLFFCALLSFPLCLGWAQEKPFAEGAFQVLEKAACRACHNSDGVASVTRLIFPEGDATPDKIDRFGRRWSCSLIESSRRSHFC